MKISLKQILVILATLVMLTVNALANILPINGMNTGQVSDSFKVFFVPAGYVFSIWGVIYLLLLAYTVYQALPAQKDNPTLKKISLWYVAGSLANSIWIFLWHYLQFNLTILFMGILLVSLLVIYLALRNSGAATNIFRNEVVRTIAVFRLSWLDHRGYHCQCNGCAGVQQVDRIWHCTRNLGTHHAGGRGGTGCLDDTEIP